MKTCLVYPCNSALTSQIPLGLISVASYAKRHGFDTCVVDTALMIKEECLIITKNIYNNIASLLYKKHRANIYALSTIVTLEIPAIQIAKHLKEIDPNIVIVLGNQYATSMDTLIMEAFPFIDLIVRGEGEITFKEVLASINNGSYFNDIKGVTYRSGNKIIRNENRVDNEDIDNYLPLDYSTLAYDPKIYTSLGVNGLVEFGRGCTYGCNFCSTSHFWNKRVRIYSVDKVVKEMKTLANKYLFETLDITFDNFGSIKENAVQLCKEIIKTHLNIKWTARCRADGLDEELMAIMKKAGCESILMGIETGNARSLRDIGKKISLASIYSSIEMAKKYDISVVGSTVVGLPNENKKSLISTLKLAAKVSAIGNGSSGFVHYCSPLSGTYFTKKYIQKKMIEHSNDATISPDFARYLEWLLVAKIGKVRRLIEDQRLIDKHSYLFSAYGYYVTTISPSVLTAASSYYNLVIKRYPLTVLLLLRKTGRNINKLFVVIEQYCSKMGIKKSILMKLDANNEGEWDDKFYNAIDNYIRSLCESDCLLENMHRYENNVYKCKAEMMANKNRKKNFCGVVDKYDYDVVDISNQLSGFSENMIENTGCKNNFKLKKCYLIITVEHSNEKNIERFKVVEIENSLYNFLIFHNKLEGNYADIASQYNCSKKEISSILSKIREELPNAFYNN